MRMYDLIYTKKTGGSLTPEQIAFWVKGVTDGTVPVEQSSALLMAICWRGMNTEETLALTLGMRDSGARMDLSPVPGVKVDKHSTGGVGDKTTLILGPIVAACGLPCAMFSGRGLGHTGGTIDKFSAIPGLNVELSAEQFRESLRRTGFANSAQTSDICPADRRLYALRDVTATVESIPLITASIMSKKLAGGADALVLDVKCGSGAFMKSLDEGRILAKSMVEVGKAHGMRIKALVTRMEEPLGWAIGNTLEVMESVEILRGLHGGGVLARMSFRLAAEMLMLGRVAGTLEEALLRVDQAVRDGSALRVLRDFVTLNGGDARALDDFSLMPQAAAITEIRADRSGFLHAMDGRSLGILAMELGAGRKAREDVLDLGAGIRVHGRVGDFVETGDTLFSVHARPGVAIPESSFRGTVELRPESAPEKHWLLDEVS